MEEKVYPSPLALHEEVISNGTVFMDTLRKFHSTMGTRFMIPILGGKDLDLHVLYVEVTKRGGFEKVYKEKRLREVIQVFNFPPTTTSAAYVLRKYYNSLLHHYEQVYFFRLQGKLIPSAAPVKKSHCKRPMPSAIESPPNSMRLNLEQQQQMVWNGGEAFSSLEIRLPIPASAPPCKHAMPHVTNSPPNSMQLSLQQQQQHQQQMVRKRGKAFSSPETADSVHLPLQQQQQHQQQMVCKRGKAFSSPETGVPAPFKSPPSKPVMPPPISMQLPLQQQKQQQMACEREEAFPTPETGAPESFTVKGVIEGEFEDGCFVTVTIGSEIFRGVLYYKPPLETPPTTLPTPNDTIVPVVTPSPNLQHKRKRGKRMRDPNLPKPNRNAYNFFFAEKHSKLKELFPKREREFNKIIGEAWNKLTAEDRMSYQDRALKDKQRYTREMEEYEERMELMPPKEFTGAGPSS